MKEKGIPQTERPSHFEIPCSTFDILPRTVLPPESQAPKPVRRRGASTGIACALIPCCLLLAGCVRRELPQNGPSGEEAALETITTPLGIEMVRLPGGEFMMGDDDGEADEKPVHRVELSPFCIDVCEVTQESFESLMGRNPSKFASPDHPVERVSWLSAVQYCNMRSFREGLSPCYDRETLECDFDADGYRLPTEAEWEYACRAGTSTPWSFGNRADQLGGHAWFKENADGSTQPVKQKDPNPWGLYDVYGNVAEWCHDYYGERYGTSEAAAKDPRGPVAGDERVLRGGSWRTSPDACRSSARSSEPPGFADVCLGYEAYGFRCVRAAAERPSTDNDQPSTE